MAANRAYSWIDLNLKKVYFFKIKLDLVVSFE